MNQKLLTKRVNFPSAKELAERYGMELTRGLELDADKSAQVRQWFEKIFESSLWDVQDAFVTGATKGIVEAYNLILDEDYYETVKKRNQASRARNKEWREKYEQEESERLRRQNNPTIDEAKQDIARYLRDMIHAKDQYKKNKKAVASAEMTYGTHVIREVVKEKFTNAQLVEEAFDVDAFVYQLTYSKVSDGTEIELPQKAENVVSFFDR